MQRKSILSCLNTFQFPWRWYITWDRFELWVVNSIVKTASIVTLWSLFNLFFGLFRPRGCTKSASLSHLFLKLRLFSCFLHPYFEFIQASNIINTLFIGIKNAFVNFRLEITFILVLFKPVLFWGFILLIFYFWFLIQIDKVVALGLINYQSLIHFWINLWLVSKFLILFIYLGFSHEFKLLFLLF